MRILIVNSEHPPVGGGAGNASAHLGKELVKMGDIVAILTSSYKNLPTEEIKDGVQIHRVRSLRKDISRSNPLEQLSFMISGILEGLPLIRKWKPDVIIPFFGIPSGPVGLMGKVLFGIPYIVSLRGGDVPGFRPYDFALVHKLSSPLLRIIWKQAGAVVANSQGLKTLAEKFAPGIPYQVIHNGVDLEFFHPPEVPPTKLNLLFVGRIVYQKGLDLLFDALSDLLDLPWQLILVGDGPARNTLQEQAAALDLEERITFLGWKSRHELQQLYQEASIFVFPSRDEGMPNAVLEAMAASLPVIASDIAGNEELIQEGVTGLLVLKEDRVLLSQAIHELLIDTTKREQFGRAARKRVETLYSWTKATQEYRQVARTVMSD